MTQSFEHAGQAEADQIEAIRRIAYERWNAEGRPDGRDVVHWLEAERTYFTALMGEPTPTSDASSLDQDLAHRPRGSRPRSTVNTKVQKTA